MGQRFTVTKIQPAFFGLKKHHIRWWISRTQIAEISPAAFVIGVTWPPIFAILGEAF
jgi:hypothetical protein